MIANNRIPFPVFRGGYIKQNNKQHIFTARNNNIANYTPFILYGKQIKINLPSKQTIKKELSFQIPISSREMNYQDIPVQIFSWNCIEDIQIAMKNQILLMNGIQIQISGDVYLTQKSSFLVRNDEVFVLNSKFEDVDKICTCKKVVQIIGEIGNIIIQSANNSLYINSQEFKNYKEFSRFARNFMPRGYIFNSLCRIIQFQRKQPIIYTFQSQTFLFFGNIFVHMEKQKIVDYYYLYPHFYNQRLGKYLIQSQNKISVVKVVYPFILVGYMNSVFEAYILGFGYNGMNRQPILSINYNKGQIVSILPSLIEDTVSAFISFKNQKIIIVQNIYPDQSKLDDIYVQKQGCIRDILPISTRMKKQLIIQNQDAKLSQIDTVAYKYINEFEFDLQSLLEKEDLNSMETAIIFNHIQIDSTLIIEIKLYLKRVIQLKASIQQADNLILNAAFLKLVYKEVEISDATLYFLATGQQYISDSELEQQQLEYSKQKARERLELKQSKLNKTEIHKQNITTKITTQYYRQQNINFFNFSKTQLTQIAQKYNLAKYNVSNVGEVSMDDVPELKSNILGEQYSPSSDKQIINIENNIKENSTEKENEAQMQQEEISDNTKQELNCIIEENLNNEKNKFDLNSKEISDIKIKSSVNESLNNQVHNINVKKSNDELDSQIDNKSRQKDVIDSQKYNTVIEDDQKNPYIKLERSSESVKENIDNLKSNTKINKTDKNQTPTKGEEINLTNNVNQLNNNLDDIYQNLDLIDQHISQEQNNSYLTNNSKQPLESNLSQENLSNFNPHQSNNLSSSSSSELEPVKPQKHIPLLPFKAPELTQEEKQAIANLPEIFKFIDKNGQINDDGLKKVDLNQFGFEVDYLVLSNFLKGVAFGHDYAGDQLSSLDIAIAQHVKNRQKEFDLSQEFIKSSSSYHQQDDEVVSLCSHTEVSFSGKTQCQIEQIQDESTEYTYEEVEEDSSTSQLSGARFLIKAAESKVEISAAMNTIQQQISKQIDKATRKHKQPNKKYIKVKKQKQVVPTYKLTTKRYKKKRINSGEYQPVKIKKSTSGSKILELKKDSTAMKLIEKTDLFISKKSEKIVQKPKAQVYQSYHKNLVVQPHILTTTLTKTQIQDSKLIQAQIAQLQQLQQQYKTEISFNDLQTEIGSILGGQFRLCQTPQIVPVDDALTDFGYTFLRTVQPALQGVFTDSIFLIFDPKFFPKDEFSRSYCTIGIYEKQHLMPALVYYFKKVFTDFYSKNIPKRVFDLIEILNAKGANIETKELHIYPISFIWCYLIQFNAKGIYDFYQTNSNHFINDHISIPMGQLFKGKSNIQSQNLIKICNFILFKSRSFWSKVEVFAAQKSTELIKNRVQKEKIEDFDQEKAMKTYEKLIIVQYQKGGIDRFQQFSEKNQFQCQDMLYMAKTSIFIDSEREFELETEFAEKAFCDAEIYNQEIRNQLLRGMIVPYSLCTQILLLSQQRVSPFVPLINLLQYKHSGGKSKEFYLIIQQIFRISPEKLAETLYKLTILEFKLTYQKVDFPSYLSFDDIFFLKRQFEKREINLQKLYLNDKEVFFLNSDQKVEENVLKAGINEYKELAQTNVQRAIRLQKLILRTYNQVTPYAMIIGDVDNLKQQANNHLEMVNNGEVFDVNSENSLDSDFSADDGAQIQRQKRNAKLGMKMAQLQQLQVIKGKNYKKQEKKKMNIALNEDQERDLVKNLYVQKQTLNEVVQNEYIWYNEVKHQIQVEKQRILSNQNNNLAEKISYDVNFNQLQDAGNVGYLKDPVVKRIPVKILKGIDRK